jgi:hypothetical protein
VFLLLQIDSPNFDSTYPSATKLLSSTMSMSNLTGLKEPVPLILIDPITGKFVLGDIAANYLFSLEKPVAVITVAGLYRTGKSFVLNNLAGRSAGFDIGSTIEPCTRGLWLWTVPAKEVGIRPNLPPGTQVLMLDTEGLGSYQQTETYDIQIFAFSLLLSSYFVYNSLGAIDEQAIDRLSLVVQLTKHIRARKTSNTTHTASLDNEADLQSLKAYFPSFLWLLRDFSLELEIAGKSITSREYLERALSTMEGKGERVEAKNRIRQFIKQFFVDRDCFTMKRPVSDEAKLQRLAQVPLSELRPEYLQQLGDLKELIFSHVEPKQIDGHVLSGRMLCELTKEYIEAINNGSVPTIATAWDSVMQLENQKALQFAVATYQMAMDKNAADAVDTSVLLLHHRQAEADAYHILHTNSVGSELAKFEEDLKQQISSLFQKYFASNEKESVDQCTRLLDDLSFPMLERVRSGDIKSMDVLESEISQVVAAYDRQARGPKRDAVLLGFTRTRLFEAIRLVHRASMSDLEEMQESRRKEAIDHAAIEYQRLEKVYETLQSQHETLSENNKLVHESKAKVDEELEELRSKVIELEVLLAEVNSKFEEEKQQIVVEKESTEKEKAEVVSTKIQLESDIERERQEKEELQKKCEEMEQELQKNKKKKGCTIC